MVYYIQSHTFMISTTNPPHYFDFDSFRNPISNHNGENSPIQQSEVVPPIIDEIDITSIIQFRYSKTVVKAYIKNPSASTTQEVTFSMLLPNTAFVSNFTIQIKGENKIYVARVVEKEEARNSYNDAVSRGQSAGIVDTDSRDVNQITMRSNLKAASKIEFTLTYEELLKRHISRYEHIIHIRPGQIVEDYKVNVFINESLPINYINVPELKTSENKITSLLKNNTIAIIKKDFGGDPRKAHIQFLPSVDDQRRMSKSMGNGMTGQFIIQYDVDRKNQASDIQVLDGYFVHFFAPDYLQPLPKHVVFVLDTSGSMRGTKLVQLKDAMMTILDDLSDKDYFNILTFSSNVNQWKPYHRPQPYHRPRQRRNAYFGNHPTASPNNGTTNSNPTVRNRYLYRARPYTQITVDNYKDCSITLCNYKDYMNWMLTSKGTNSLLKLARKHVLNLNANGGTDVNNAILEALRLVKRVNTSENIPSNIKPMIIFLTDGQATSGITSSEQIQKNIVKANKNIHVPIYGLAFGTGADFNLLKAISRENGAFSRQIYEASDAAIQLEDFYSEISSPLLTNVSFNYVGKSFKSKIDKNLNTFFKGSEYIVAGQFEKFNNQHKMKEEVEIVVLADGSSSKYSETIRQCQPISGHQPVEYEIMEWRGDNENQNFAFNTGKVSDNIYLPNSISFSKRDFSMKICT